MRSKPPEPLRLDCEGQPLPPRQKRYPSVQVPRLLTDAEQRTLAAVESWVRLGRSSRATPLSALIDDGDWSVPNIRLSHSHRSLCWFRLCLLKAAAQHRDQIDDFKAVIERIEGQETDDLSLARGIELASQLIAATQGRERKFVRQRGLDRPEEVAEPQQETG